MIVATAVLVQSLLPLAPPSFGPHPYPAQKSEQVTTGQCGRQDVKVRVTRQASTPKQDTQQVVEVTIAGKRLRKADQLSISRAAADLGAVSNVYIYCLEGMLAQLWLVGPHGADQIKRMLVSFDRGRVTYVK